MFWGDVAEKPKASCSPIHVLSAGATVYPVSHVEHIALSALASYEQVTQLVGQPETTHK